MTNYKAGAIKFWGRWYGRPYDNIYEVSDIKLIEQNDCVIIKFTDGSELQAYGINNVEFVSDTVGIRSAHKLIWNTTYYEEGGNPIKYVETYVVVGGKVLLTNNRTDDVKEYKPEGSAFEVVTLF